MKSRYNIYTRSNFKSQEYTIAELKEKIQSHYSMKSNLENEIPRHIAVGVFNVSVDKLRQHLIDRQERIASCLLEMHSLRLRTQAEEALDESRAIFHKLRVEPPSIEQLLEIREWMDGLPAFLEGQQKSLQKIKAEYEALDTFHWSLNDDDFQVKWQAMLFPSKIQMQVSLRDR